jgi:hypothetical protein
MPKRFTIKHQPRQLTTWQMAKKYGLSRRDYLKIIRAVAGSAVVAEMIKKQISLERLSRIAIRAKRDQQRRRRRRTHKFICPRNPGCGLVEICRPACIGRG